MKFTADLNQSSLNWNNANVFEYKYIYYLARMVEERYIKIGIPNRSYIDTREANFYTSDLTQCAWDFNKFFPFGILDFHQLQMLYSMMIFLGTHVYFNEDNLDENNWVNRR